MKRRKTHKSCSICKEIFVVSVENFYMNPKTKMYSSYCRDCHKSSRSKKHKLRTYNLTEQELDQLLSTKNCEICNQPFDSTNTPAIDHCHSSLKVRGLLCHVCNRGLGHFKDNIDLLLNAIKYLNRATH
jgi:hypothetical protein